MASESNVSQQNYPGLYAGRVEGVEDLPPGYIKVSIPSVFGSENSELHQIARPCFPYGHFFVPQKGSHVWISFEEGNPTAPVWLGVWYPSPDVPETVNLEAPAQQSVRSASGHMVILHDEQEATLLKISDLENNLNILEFANASITIKSKGRIIIDAPNVTIAGRFVEMGTNRII